MLVDKAGHDVHHECERRCKRDRLQEGEVAVTGAGRLKCDHIIHAVRPYYSHN